MTNEETKQAERNRVLALIRYEQERGRVGLRTLKDSVMTGVTVQDIKPPPLARAIQDIASHADQAERDGDQRLHHALVTCQSALVLILRDRLTAAGAGQSDGAVSSEPPGDGCDGCRHWDKFLGTCSGGEHTVSLVNTPQGVRPPWCPGFETGCRVGVSES